MKFVQKRIGGNYFFEVIFVDYIQLNGMENNDQLVLSILVTEEQKETIQALFNHNNWDFIETNKTPEAEQSVSGASSNGESVQGHADNIQPAETFQESDLSDSDNDTCEHCFCSPCVTVNEQSWLGNGRAPHTKNKKSRKIRYKKFWSMLDRRNAWRNKRYLKKKETLMKMHNLEADVVRIQREIMPECVLDLVRSRYPNPAGEPYSGHCW